MTTPYLTIDLAKIEHNARVIVELCSAHGIEVTGVTKGVCGHPEVAKAMLRGGVASIGDSRPANIRCMREGGVEAPFMLIRLPARSAVDTMVELADVSLNSELSVLAALSNAAKRRGTVHDVIVMVDLGDLREGILPEELESFMEAAMRLDGIRVAGLGTNLGCFAGVVPTRENMEQLAALAHGVERAHGLRLAYISGLNSSGLELIEAGGVPSTVNHARIGEGILLGRETTHRRPWSGTHQDAFVLHAEILEMHNKPSMPIGERAEDAFGALPEFVDRGNRTRVLVNVGREDIDVDGIVPRDPRLVVLGASSGYLVLDASVAASDIHVGDVLDFSLNYGALLAAMTSAYVEKRCL